MYSPPSNHHGGEIPLQFLPIQDNRISWFSLIKNQINYQNNSHNSHSGENGKSQAKINHRNFHKFSQNFPYQSVNLKF
jgi:hypothetical protein